MDLGLSIYNKGIMGITNKLVRFNGILSRIEMKTNKRDQFGAT